MKLARLIYRKAKTASEYKGAEIVVRAYVNNGNLCADVIHTQNNARKVDSFCGGNPTKLAEKVADFANDRLLDCDTILCSNDLPVSTQGHPECYNKFKDTFIAEIEAITDQARAVKEAEERSAEYVENKYGGWLRRRNEEAKKKIFGTE